MKILARSKDFPGASWTGAEAILRAEAAEVWRLQKAGAIRNIWFTHPDRDAVIILECSSVDEARSLLAALPLVKERFIQFDVAELRPYDGLERLFEGPPPNPHSAL
jgi:muconolactone delta-isomerase